MCIEIELPDHLVTWAQLYKDWIMLSNVKIAIQQIIDSKTYYIEIDR